MKNHKIIPTLKDVMLKAPERIKNMPEFGRVAEEFGIEGEHKIKGRFEIGLQYHYTMEPQTCVCVPIEDGMDVYSATQWMDAAQVAIANSINVKNNHINMNVRRLGGGFGAKISRNIQVACAAAIAAHLLNRPVRFVMTIEANMNIAGKRYAVINDYDVEVDDNGKIQKLVTDYVEDMGCSNNEAGEIWKQMSWKM